MTPLKHIADTLTKAQRAAIIGAWQASWCEWYMPHETRWDVRRRLVAKGIFGRRIGNPMLKLGIELRRYLQDQAHD